MECNRDEAIKAKSLAERSMGNKDFMSARRFALKAQQLYPNLEDISKIILVCDVLCSENIIVCRKEENDWYAILKIEPTADEATIRKQYRKLVLSLHPDKNKFPGAKEAFHLVNEAHRTLLDRKDRFAYDLKLQVARSQVKTKVRLQSYKKSNTAQYPQGQNINENVAPQWKNQQDQQNHQSVDNRKTFWTACTSCLTRFMYYNEIMGKPLNCRVCKAVFTAMQTNAPCPPDPSLQGDSASFNRQTSQSTHKVSDPRVVVQRENDNKKISESEDVLTHNLSEDPNPKGKTSKVDSMFEKMGSAQENVCSKMAFQRGGEDSHSEPNNRHIPPSNESFKAEIGTSSNVESMSGKMGSAQENSCSTMTFQRNGEDSHSEPNNRHVPPLNESSKAEIGTSSNVEFMSGKMGSGQENSCPTMTFQRDGEDSHSEPNNRYIPPLNESFKAEIETSYVKSTIEEPTTFGKLDSGVQNKRQRRGSISESEENSSGNGEDSHSEPNNRYIPPLNESFKAEIKTSYVKSTIEEPTTFGKLDSGVQKKRQRKGSISESEENSSGNGGDVGHVTSATKEIPIHKDNYVESAFQDNLHQVFNAHESYEYSAPDFSNFSDLRAHSVFEKGQIWAVYDTLDAMPRFYALITKVFSPKFKVELIWLEPDPDDEEETKWVEEGLPASCGIFRYGNSDVSQELSIFSHLVCWEKGSTDGTVEVHPKKGETWALYKDWDISYACCETKKNFAYEFVEILSDYANGIGVYVAFLYKVEGFSCIFNRETKRALKLFLIPAKERFRFSHRVPSFKMTGKERKGFLAGSFELDPASLPISMTESVDQNHVHPSTRDVSVDEKANSDGNAPKTEENAPCFAEVEETLEINSTSQDLRELRPNSELEFYNFQENISPNKFHVGQIWAIYSDEDSMPKYYCKITRIKPSPIFNLYVTWFMACLPPEGMINWVDDEMLTAVGNFELIDGKPQKYSSTDPFSHVVRAEPTDYQDVYSIFPKKDQFWALYKNWNPFLNLSDLDDCEYEIVRVVGEKDLCIVVSVMKPIKGFKAVFRPQVEGQSIQTVEISKTEILRFSHQIPAFQLTKEIGGSLQGFWELDAAALPHLLVNQ